MKEIKTMMSRIFLFIASAGFPLGAGSTAWAQNRDYWPDHMMGEGGWIMGPLMMLFFFVILVIVVVLIVRWLGPSQSASGRDREQQRTALTILEERFARGEIDAAEFREKKEMIRK